MLADPQLATKVGVVSGGGGGNSLQGIEDGGGGLVVVVRGGEGGKEGGEKAPSGLREVQRRLIRTDVYLEFGTWRW